MIQKEEVASFFFFSFFNSLIEIAMDKYPKPNISPLVSAPVPAVIQKLLQGFALQKDIIVKPHSKYHKWEKGPFSRGYIYIYPLIALDEDAERKKVDLCYMPPIQFCTVEA